MRHTMLLAAALSTLAVPAVAQEVDARAKALTLTSSVAFRLIHSKAEGDCSRCHSPKGWLPAKFDHGRTGFLLAGAHTSVRCRGCHLASFATPIPRSCGGCHRDAHRNELGARCEGCHDEKSWRSRYDASAHRRTAFPLSGAHATIPCSQCHGDAFSRGFVRTTAACVRCHEDDYRRAAMTSIDHIAAGFDTGCQRCHTAFSFTRAQFPEHDRCFLVTGGPHHGIGCRTCHQAGFADGRPDGTCDTKTAACTSCHEHSCDRTDREHDDVPGYQCKDLKCYECHRFAAE